MKGWLRTAWITSWIAPLGFVVTLLTMALALAAERPGSPLRDLGPFLQAGAMIFGTISLLAHTVFVYRVHKGTGLAAEEGARLYGRVILGFGYAEWRRAVQRNK